MQGQIHWFSSDFLAGFSLVVEDAGFPLSSEEFYDFRFRGYVTQTVALFAGCKHNI